MNYFVQMYLEKYVMYSTANKKVTQFIRLENIHCVAVLLRVSETVNLNLLLFIINLLNKTLFNYNLNQF